MKQAFLDKSLAFILKNQDKYKEEDIEKLRYGLEGIYLTITKTIILVGLSILLGIGKEFFIMMVLFNIIRYPAFGYHADSSIQCLILSGGIFLGFTYLSTIITLSFQTKLILYGGVFILFLLFAPADTVKRPLTNKKKRIIRKIASLLVLGLYGIFIFMLKTKESNYFLMSIIIEAIFISPLPYVLFKSSYQNYKKVGLNRNV